jgi:hypothetical protein
LNAFLAKKWPIRILLLVLVVGVLSAVPKLPKDQTLRIDLGDSSKIIQTLTLRWAVAGAPQSKNPSIEDWTGEVTFRYEKNAAPRVVQQEMRLADGEYVVEIELITGGGRAVTRKVVALQGGSTTIDASTFALANPPAENGGTK